MRTPFDGALKIRAPQTTNARSRRGERRVDLMARSASSGLEGVQIGESGQRSLDVWLHCGWDGRIGQGCCVLMFAVLRSRLQQFRVPILRRSAAFESARSAQQSNGAALAIRRGPRPRNASDATQLPRRIRFIHRSVAGCFPQSRSLCPLQVAGCNSRVTRATSAFSWLFEAARAACQECARRSAALCTWGL